MSDSKHDAKVAGMKRNLAEKTGRTLEQWVDHLRAEGPTDVAQHQTWLKEQGLGHFQARLVASTACDT